MKKILPVLFLMFTISVMAQSTHNIDFEPAGTGADWEWVVVENGSNPPLEFIANPVGGGINTSSKVAKFTVKQNGAPWALCYTDDDGEFTFDAANCIVKIMVYKPVISNVTIKFEGLSPAVEIAVANTVINQWQELTYNFTASIGKTYSRLIVIPDFTFNPRTQDRIIYFDNVKVPDGTVAPPLPEPTTVPPIPSHAQADVISIYTEVYNNLPGTNFTPNWGQSTSVTVNYMAAGNATLKYENLNYQGTEYMNQNVSLFNFLHVDFWTANSTELKFYLISPGAETFYTLPVVHNAWVSVDIPLSGYVPPVNLSNVFQFKVVGNGTVFFDNWYFWKNPTAQGSDATLSNLLVSGTTVPGFSPIDLSYDVVLPYGTTVVPVVTAVTNDPNASFVVNNAASLPGTTNVVVTAQNGINTLTYSVNFSLASPEPSTVPSIPAHAQENVISVYSDQYSNLAGTNFNPWWGQQTIVTVNYVVAGNNTLRYQNLNYQGTEFTSQNVSDYDYLHVDFWTSNSTDLGIYLISQGPIEKEYVFTIVPQQWVSVDIPLTYFSPPVNLSQVFQFKIEGNGDIWFDNLYFWKSPGTGSLTISPADGSLNVPITVNPTFSFTVPVEKANGSAISNSDIPSIVTLKLGNAGGAAVPFTGTINTAKTLITIIPTGGLQYEQTYYLALNNDVIRYQGGDPVAGQSVTFSTLPAPKPYLALNIKDNFENDGFGNIENWMFQDSPNLVDLAITGDPVDPANNVAEYNRSGAFLYTNAQFILDHRMKLTQRNKFRIKVFFPSTNVYDRGLTPTAAIKLQNSLLGPNAYTTQTEIIQTVTQFDQWVSLDFVFTSAADSVNYDQIIVQLGGENHNNPGLFYFDDFILLPVSSGILTNFNATPRNGFSPMAVQFTDLSIGNITQWKWDFNNDGIIDSNIKNPLFIYNTPGVYSVKLKVSTNPFTSDELIKTEYIVVSELIEPSYIYTDFDANVNVEFSGWPVVPEVVANPNPSGINTSANVGKLSRSAEPYSNIFTVVDSTVNFAEDHYFQFSIYSPVACEVLLKLESTLNPAQFTQRSANVTLVNTWQSLNFDFSGEESNIYDNIILFFDFEGTMLNVFYFDDVKGPQPNGEPLYKPLLESDIQDNFENNGYATISNWKFQDGPDLVDLTTVVDPVNAGNHVAEYNRSGGFLYTNAQVILDHRMNLTNRHVFEMRVYFPSSNDYSGALTTTAAIKLQNSLLGPNAWTTQTEILQIVTEFDQWQNLTFDFGNVANRDDYDQIVIQLGGENHLVPAQFYFDDLVLRLPFNQMIAPQTGWSGISSFVIPANASIEELFGNFANDIEIIRGDDGIYYPSQGINTLGNWDSQKGYIIKMINGVQIPFAGYEVASRTITLAAGWSVIPVTTSCEINTAALFGGFTQVVAIKEVAGTGTYWPEKAINTLPVLKPAKAYFIYTTEGITFTYPECSGSYELIWADDFD